MPNWLDHKQITRKVRVYTRRCVELFPLTGLGLLVLAAAVGMLKWLAYGQLDLVLFVVGYAAIGLVAITVTLVTLCAAWVRWKGCDGRTSVQGAETGRASETGVRLPSLRFVPLVQLRWSWVTPEALEVGMRSGGGWLHELVFPWQRGRHRRVVRAIAVQDPFGLARVAWRREEATGLDVLPHRGALRRMPVLTALSHGDDLPHPFGVAEGDRMELRRYVAGDPARFIHWKAYARTRKLMVRHPERALTPARRTAAFLVAGEQDDATAAAARVALEEGLLGSEWSFGSDVDPVGTSQLGDALVIVMRSREARAGAGAALAGFIERASKTGPVSVLLFVPPVPGPWLDQVVAAVGRQRGPVRAVIGIDGLAEKPAPATWRRWLARAPEIEGHETALLWQVIRRLRAAHCETLILDRASGRVLSEGHLRPSSTANQARVDQPARSKATGTRIKGARTERGKAA